MRILLLEDAPIFKYGFAAAMIKKGIEVKYASICSEIHKGNLYALQEEIEQFKPNAILNAGMCVMYNLSSMFNIIKNYSIPYIYWAIEDPVYFTHISLKHAMMSSMCMTTAAECIPKYKKYGINAVFMMFGCNKDFHYKGNFNSKFDHDIIFIGNNYNQHFSRKKGVDIILKPLIKRGYDLKVYGNEWWFDTSQNFVLDKKYYGGYCQYKELPDAYATAKIALGMHSVANSNTMMSMRTFEIMGCGGFYLTQHTPAIQRYFSNEKHLTWSESSYATLRMVDRYLNNKDGRERIALEGQKECYLKHNYEKKVDNFIHELKIRNIWR
ncbi:glycosyltransferase [Clostridium sp. OS1-26]|uniref:CgeB family protein n=1 Tax=Clostridium sp. OS1-26 TaxID=3070681 RepID=UPI0027E0701F|nr:glycosyltransferase [Clostridium sp. OS1-26]WML35824.1 glycosyltransferase [Clostridium sp. OS1-26]